MKKVVLLIFAISLCSCATLKVQVKTADKDSLDVYYDKIDKNRVLAYQYQQGISYLLSSKIISNRSEITSLFSDFLKKDVSDVEYINEMKSSFSEKYIVVVDGLLIKMNNNSKLIIDKKYNEALLGYYDMFEDYLKLKKDINNENFLSEKDKTDFAIDANLKLNTANKMFFNGRANLLGDEMVGYITKKENCHLWKSTYNRTVSRTYFGNADIAVILNDLPNNYNNNYTIKGVRLDGARLIQSSFDVVTQAINVAASMYGISTANQGDTNSFYPESFTLINELPSKTIELENKNALFLEVRKQLIIKILNEDMTSKNLNEMKKSIDRINAFWEFYNVKL